MLSRLFILSLATVALVGCSSTPSSDTPTDTSSDTPAETEVQADQSSAEAVVESFYALYMNGDREEALALVEPDSRDILDGILAGLESEGWEYTKVEVQSAEGNEVTIYMEIDIDGEMDDGTDQVEVIEVDGKWWIVDLPM